MRRDAPGQVCHYSNICLHGWLAKQHLKTISLSCFPMSPVSGRKQIHMKTILLARSCCAFPPFSYSPSCSSISHCLRFTCHLFDTFWLDLIISACLLHCQYFCHVSLWTVYHTLFCFMEDGGGWSIAHFPPESRTKRPLLEKGHANCPVFYTWLHTVSDSFLKGNQSWTAVILTYLMKASEETCIDNMPQGKYITM